MGFVNDEQRRAYQRGYQAAYQIPARSDWTTALRRIRRRHRGSPWLDTITRGFIAGASARRGEDVARRKAQWYQRHRPQIVAKQRRQRRTTRTAAGMAVIARIAGAK